jgi:hypothetical protein
LDRTALAAVERLLRIVEARAAALRSATSCLPRGDARGGGGPAWWRPRPQRPNGLLIDASRIADASLALAGAGLGPVTPSPDFVFDVSCAPFRP